MLNITFKFEYYCTIYVWGIAYCVAYECPAGIDGSHFWGCTVLMLPVNDLLKSMPWKIMVFLTGKNKNKKPWAHRTTHNIMV
jgi:hypothetical protein